MRRSCAIADPKRAGRPGQDRPAGCGEPAGSTGRASDGGAVRDAGHEAMRDLVRARLDAVHRTAPGGASKLSGFCCATAITWVGPWTEDASSGGWRVSSSNRARPITSRSKIMCRGRRPAAVRRDRLTAQIAGDAAGLNLAPMVAALQTMRGMALVNAATLIAELDDLSRFTVTQLMAYLGLVPSEPSSGASVKRGGLTKPAPGGEQGAGNQWLAGC